MFYLNILTIHLQMDSGNLNFLHKSPMMLSGVSVPAHPQRRDQHPLKHIAMVTDLLEAIIITMVMAIIMVIIHAPEVAEESSRHTVHSAHVIAKLKSHLLYMPTCVLKGSGSPCKLM